MTAITTKLFECGLSGDRVRAILAIEAALKTLPPATGDAPNLVETFAATINDLVERSPASAARPATLAGTDADRLAALEEAAKHFLNFEKALETIQPGAPVKRLIDPTLILSGQPFVVELKTENFKALVDAFYVGRPRQ